LRGIAAARPGCDIGDIGEEISRTARQNGWQVVLDYGGHGIDRGRLHADPFVDNARTDRRLRLRPGMVLAIEPMFVAGPNAKTETAADGWTVLANGPTAHFEHSILITDSKPRVLTCHDSL
jgi:methionyl aminopeptidase